MHLVIATVNEMYFDGEAESLTAPGAAGELTVLGSHMPLVTTLKPGVLIVRQSGAEPKEFPIGGGVLEVRRDGATIIL